MTRARQHAMRIFRAALKAVDPELAVKQALGNLGKAANIYVVGAGKASAAMARGVERSLGSRVSGGWINVPDGLAFRTKQIHVHAAGHPVPDQRGVDGARRILELAQSAGKGDLVLCLISGGASALMPAPVEGLSLSEKQEITKMLLQRGATIHELNTVRKHLSRIKGGQLAVAAYPARVVCLILSDVVGDDLSMIGSGPTVPDTTSVADAQAVLRKYRVPCPQDLTDTPPSHHPAFGRTKNVVVGSNRLAIDAAAKTAQTLGYRPIVLSTTIEGETRDIARMHAAIAREVVASGRPGKAPACVLSGGETTVTVRGEGSGGRNQEFALAAAFDLQESGVTLLSVGTDGIDGPTDAAGAFADGTTVARGNALGLDARAFLENNDSYNYFSELGDLIKTGPTGTNVMDLRVMLIGRPA